METPLDQSYSTAVALALLALCPFIVLTTATTLFQQDLLHDLHTSMFGLQLAGGLGNAAYAFGAVASADLVQRLQARHLFLACEVGFVVGSLLVLVSHGIVLFTTGRAVQGLATGMLLVAALPPLVTKHGAEKLPTTAAVVNLGLFGMVVLGPVVGGVLGSEHHWRILFAVVAALAAVSFVLGLFGFARSEPGAPDSKFDVAGVALALGGTALPFIGVSFLSRGAATSLLFIVPAALGVLFAVLLVVVEYRKEDALMPVRIIAHTLPVTGTAVAMIVGASFTSVLELAELDLTKLAHHTPLADAALLAPQAAGVVVAAWLFKRALPTKWTPVLALSGLLSAIAGAAILTADLSPTAVAVASVLLGYGAGAGVAPGLFMAGLSVPSTKIGQTFALVELLRAEAAFLVGPVLLHVAMAELPLSHGLHVALLIALVGTAILGAGALALYVLGGARPHDPDLETWLEGEGSAYESPRLAAVVRES